MWEKMQALYFFKALKISRKCYDSCKVPQLRLTIPLQSWIKLITWESTFFFVNTSLSGCFLQRKHLCAAAETISSVVLTSEVRTRTLKPETTFSYLRPSGRKRWSLNTQDKKLELKWLLDAFLNFYTIMPCVCLFVFICEQLPQAQGQKPHIKVTGGQHTAHRFYVTLLHRTTSVMRMTAVFTTAGDITGRRCLLFHRHKRSRTLRYSWNVFPPLALSFRTHVQGLTTRRERSWFCFAVAVVCGLSLCHGTC